MKLKHRRRLRGIIAQINVAILGGETLTLLGTQNIDPKRLLMQIREGTRSITNQQLLDAIRRTF